MSLPIAALPAAESNAAAEPRAAARQARSRDPSQGPTQTWAEALAQATAPSTATPATRARAAPPTAMASGAKSAGAAHLSELATGSPSGAAAAMPNASTEAVMAPPKEFGDQTGILAEPPLQSGPRDPADTGRDQATAASGIALADRHETAQGGTGTKAASSAATRSPLQASSAVLSGQPVAPHPVAPHKDERRHHRQQADTPTPTASSDPSVNLGANVVAVAVTAPLRPDPAPPAAPQTRSDETVKGQAAESGADAAAGSGTARPSMAVPAPIAMALPQGAASAPTALAIPRARPAVSGSPPAPPAAAPLAQAPSDAAQTGVAPPNEEQGAAVLQADAAPAPPSPVSAGAGTHPAMPATATTAMQTEVAAPAGLPRPGSQLMHEAADRPAGTSDAGLTDRMRAVPITARTPGGDSSAISLAVPPSTRPNDGKSLAVAHDIFGSGSAPAAVTGGGPVPLAALAAGVGGSPQSPGPSSAAVLSQSSLPGQAPAVPATATALAASVVAMSQSGQSTAVLRLDPPGLGILSVHIALSANAIVNVVFVPSVPQTAQLIHSALPDLHHAMASAGLSLGEAQVGGGVGGGTGGNPNGQAGNQTRDGNRFAQTTMLGRTASEADTALAKDTLRGARAVA